MGFNLIQILISILKEGFQMGYYFNDELNYTILSIFLIWRLISQDKCRPCCGFTETTYSGGKEMGRPGLFHKVDEVLGEH